MGWFSQSCSAADEYRRIEREAVGQFEAPRLTVDDWMAAARITDAMALLELRRLVGLLEGKERFPEIDAVELPNEGRELSLDDFCERYLAPLAAELFRQRNPALAHPEWV